jgi:hypothetical protein
MKTQQRENQTKKVLKYLIKKGSRGATNFEMMMKLYMCDVRKRISNINADKEIPYIIVSEWEETKGGARVKRYWAEKTDQNER